MLTDEEKSRIRLEETFRLEVRRELEATAPRPTLAARGWSLLNSSFVLWFFSSVVISLITVLYTAHQNNHAAEVQKAELVRKLDNEISNRAFQALQGLRISELNIRNGTTHTTPDGIYTYVVQYLDNFFIHNQQNPGDFSVYPEFRERSFRSLLVEMRNTLGETQHLEFDGVASAFENLADLGSTHAQENPSGATSDSSQKNTLEAVTKASNILKERILIERWRKLIPSL